MIQTWPQYEGEATQYSVDWNVKVSKLSTTVNSVAWSVESGSALVSGETLASNVATALVTTDSVDCSLIKLTATFADSQIDVHYFKVRVDDPKCSVNSRGY